VRQLRRQRAVRKLRCASGLRSWLVKSRVRFDYTYLYDDDGDRVEETVNGTATYYLIDTNNPTGYDQPIEQKSSPTATPSETYVIGDRVLGQADGSGTPTWLLVDGHGSTRLLTNASGTVTAILNYDAFGNALNFNPATIGTIWQFGGDGYYDYASGLTFHSNGRPSSSILARFFILDIPGYQNKFKPITENLYLLDDADPINRRDPSGHFGLIDTLSAAAGEAALEGGADGLFSAADAFAGDIAADITAQDMVAGVLADTIESGASDAAVNAATSFATYAEQFTAQVAGKAISVIGSYPGYLTLASAVGASAFSIPLEDWDELGAYGGTEAQWAANQTFLDAAIAAGQKFVLSTPANAIKAGTWLAQEVGYLLSQGYQWADGGNTLVPPAGG
jgi:hypothetical protein